MRLSSSSSELSPCEARIPASGTLECYCRKSPTICAVAAEVRPSPRFTKTVCGVDPRVPRAKDRDLRFTESIRSTLPKLLADLQVQTLLDAPCGDFCWMKEVPLKLKQYFGIDIVRPLIESNASLYGNSERQFLLCDLVNDELPRADLILCRHLLIHLTFEEGPARAQKFPAHGSALSSDQRSAEGDDQQQNSAYRKFSSTESQTSAILTACSNCVAGRQLRWRWLWNPGAV